MVGGDGCRLIKLPFAIRNGTTINTSTRAAPISAGLSYTIIGFRSGQRGLHLGTMKMSAFRHAKFHR